jgi:hypothetical protein
MRFKALVLALVVALPAPGFAQIEMPDARQMSGTPLPAPELANGVVTVRVVRERMGNNISGQTVTLTGGGQTKSGVSDAQGRVSFEGFPAGTPVTAEVVVDGEKLISQTFPVPARGGMRVALVAGGAAAAAADKAAADAAAKEPPRPGVVEFGGDSRIVFEYQTDVLTVFYIFDVVNNARTPIDVGRPLTFDLPDGATGASPLQESSKQVGVSGEHVTITGPFAPGKTPIQIGYSLPNAGPNYVFRQQWPAAFEQVLIAAEKFGAMRMSSPQVKDTRDVTSDGQSFILGEGGRLNAGDTLVVNFTGLPAHAKTNRVAVLVAGLAIVLAGLWFGLTPPASEAAAKAKLQARREKLMADLVALERKRQTRPLNEAEAAKRDRLVAELEHVMQALDQGAAA